MQDPAYLGDAVYASHDGYLLWLSLNSHESEPLVGLEAGVLRALNNYAVKIGMVSPETLLKPP